MFRVCVRQCIGYGCNVPTRSYGSVPERWGTVHKCIGVDKGFLTKSVRASLKLDGHIYFLVIEVFVAFSDFLFQRGTCIIFIRYGFQTFNCVFQRWASTSHEEYEQVGHTEVRRKRVSARKIIATQHTAWAARVKERVQSEQLTFYHLIIDFLFLGIYGESGSSSCLNFGVQYCPKNEMADYYVPH